MDKAAVAKELAELGQLEHEALGVLRRVARKRCALLRQVAEHDGTAEVVAASAAPKTEPPNRG